MRLTFLAFITALPFALAAQTPNILSKTEKNEGWQLLFDGSSTKGWHMYGQPTAGIWTVKDGAITPDTTQKGHGDLLTDGVYDNFDLKLEWKMSPKGNSGILFYI